MSAGRHSEVVSGNWKPETDSGPKSPAEAGCDVSRQKSHLGEVGVAPLDGRLASQAQMRPPMVVVPDEVVDDADARGTRLRLMDGEAFVVRWS